MNVHQISMNLTGMERDDLACYMFDEAVLWFGSQIEAKLHEFDKKTGKSLYSLDFLLKSPEKRKNPSISELHQHFGNVTGIEIG